MKRFFILFSIFSIAFITRVWAQMVTISGSVKTADGSAVARASVVLNGTRYKTSADSSGHFSLANVKLDNYKITVTAVGYKSATESFYANHDITLSIVLVSDVKQLKDVNVKAGKDNNFGIVRLRAVEGTAINAGKKSEVIVMSDVVANKGANVTRQIYAKVAGLNVWESDGAGIQLGIGGRGLNPNRVTNFNTRQNGYDISADALGYPESYYTPPAELTDRIEILRGAASLQYGTQFGGLINFKLNEPPRDKEIEFTTRATAGSWGFLNSTSSLGGTVKKWQYYVLYQHKQGDDWRANGHFNVNTAYGNVTYNANDKLSVTLQYTFMNYLAHQPGGLSDLEFAKDPRQSIRERNWFRVNWNLGAAIFDYKFNDNLKLNSRFFGLVASRQAIGFLDYITRTDVGGERNLYKDKYDNYGNETRLLYNYKINDNPQNLLVGMRYYRGHTDRQQGLGNAASTGFNSDFEFSNSNAAQEAYSHYVFPNYNLAFFVENIFHITPKFSIIPGIRFENIITRADGSYTLINRDNAGNIILKQPTHDLLDNTRHFLIGGIGFSYIQNDALQLYGNISQNYRAINFNDLNTSIKGLTVDRNLKDETGYSADAGLRGNVSDMFNYDANVFMLSYDNRIGTLNQAAGFVRTNIGRSLNVGIESFGELEFLHYLRGYKSDTKLSVFGNVALIHARYTKVKESAYNGNHVEMAPEVIIKSGLTYRTPKFTVNYQVAYTGSQFTDATNAVQTPNAIIGEVPAYTVMDLSATYKFNKTFSLEGSINNLADARYFTRRAESYPGPGIVPANARAYFLTLQMKL